MDGAQRKRQRPAATGTCPPLPALPFQPQLLSGTLNRPRAHEAECIRMRMCKCTHTHPCAIFAQIAANST